MMLTKVCSFRQSPSLSRVYKRAPKSNPASQFVLESGNRARLPTPHDYGGEGNFVSSHAPLGSLKVRLHKQGEGHTEMARATLGHLGGASAMTK